MNAKLKVMKRASLTVTELADAIWPQGATYCGSIASCLTCYQIDTWLSKAIGVNQPSCLSPDETLSSTSGGGFALDTKVPAGHCCMGHGKHDQLFTSFSTNSTLAVMEGPTNKEILSILQSNLVTLTCPLLSICMRIPHRVFTYRVPNGRKVAQWCTITSDTRIAVLPKRSTILFIQHWRSRREAPSHLQATITTTEK